MVHAGDSKHCQSASRHITLHHFSRRSALYSCTLQVVENTHPYTSKNLYPKTGNMSKTTKQLFSDKMGETCSKIAQLFIKRKLFWGIY